MRPDQIPPLPRKKPADVIRLDVLEHLLRLRFPEGEVEATMQAAQMVANYTNPTKD